MPDGLGDAELLSSRESAHGHTNLRYIPDEHHERQAHLTLRVYTSKEGHGLFVQKKACSRGAGGHRCGG